MEQELLEKLRFKLRLWLRSRYILAVRNVIRRLGLKYVRMLVYERPLDTKIPAVETKVPVEIRQVSVEDVNNGCYQGIGLIPGGGPGRHSAALRKLRSGDICLVAVVGDSIGGYVWVDFQSRRYEPAIEREESFAAGEALICNLLVFSRFRKKGIGQKLNEEGLRFLSSRGFSKAKAYVEGDNVTSMRSFEAVGFYPARVISCLRIIGFKRLRECPVEEGFAGNAR